MQGTLTPFQVERRVNHGVGYYQKNVAKFLFFHEEANMARMQSPTILNPAVLVPVNPEIERYMRSLAGQTDHPVLAEMEAVAKQNNFPIVGRLVGVFLETLAKMINANNIFEFGSGYGYSAYWFARAVGTKGQVICSDGDPSNREKAERYLKSADLWDRIDFRSGFAQEVFAQTEGLFDICYNDVDKGDYPQVWQLARERIRPGGLYIADNVLWHGRVAVEHYVDIVPGWTEAILEHNRLIFNDPDFDAFINPTRDGVVVARKKTN
jgi:predicted O-methyltransferase YrrM